jgi:hypothetical protein
LIYLICVFVLGHDSRFLLTLWKSQYQRWHYIIKKMFVIEWYNLLSCFFLVGHCFSAQFALVFSPLETVFSNPEI